MLQAALMPFGDKLGKYSAYMHRLQCKLVWDKGDFACCCRRLACLLRLGEGKESFLCT